MSVPDGDWTLTLDAPYGGVRGAIVTSTLAFSRLSVGSATTKTLMDFGGCKYENDVENATCTRVREGGCGAEIYAATATSSCSMKRNEGR